MPKWWQPGNEKEFRRTPWINDKATAFLESILKPSYDVCEFGGGGSTIWLADKVNSVETYEPKAEWYRILKDVVPANVKLINSGVPPISEFDLYFIDGEPVTERGKWITRAMSFISPAGWIVLDNANRPEYAEERKAIQAACKEYFTFDGNEHGTLYLMTEFYRML